MRSLIRDLLPGQDYLMQFRANNGTETSAWSPLYKFRTDGDVVAPMPPANLQWIPTGESFLATWTAPTLDGPDASGSNKPLKDFKDFVVTVSNEAGTVSKTYYITASTFELTLPMNVDVFGSIELTVKISVRSRDNNLNMSAAVTKTAVEDTPPTPSTPVVTSTSGQIAIEWDGATTLGTINAFNLGHVEIHGSTTNNFTPSASTVVGRFEGWVSGKQGTVLTGLTYGTQYYFKLVSVNKKGKKSPPSGQATGTPARLSGLDIDANANLSASQMNFTARGLGGANAFYSDTLLTGTSQNGVTFKEGDILYITAAPPATNAGKTYRRSSGGAWVEDTKIGVVSGTKILASTLTADAVGTNQIITTSANIGTAVIDAANIATVNAATITAGVLQSSQTVTFGGGTARPAWSFDLAGNAQLSNANVRGDLVVGNSGDSAGVKSASVVRSFDYIANTAGWAIKGDGTVEFNNGTFRGAINGATIVGSTYKTAETGRRVEINTSGLFNGEVRFISPGGEISRIRSWTGNGTNEVIQMGFPVPNTHSSWNAIQVQENESIFLSASYVNVIAGGEDKGIARGLKVHWLPSQADAPGGLPGPTSIERFSIDPTDTEIFDGTGQLRHQIGSQDIWWWDAGGRHRMALYNNGGFGLWDANNQQRIQLTNDGHFIVRDNAGVSRFATNPNDMYGYDKEGGVVLWHDWSTATWTINPYGANLGVPVGSFQIRHNDRLINNSPKIMLWNGANFGGLIKYYADADGGRIEFKDWADTGFIPIRASNVAIPSDARLKSDIEDLDISALTAIKGTKVKRYKIKNNADRAKRKKDGTISDEVSEVSELTDEIGLIAQEAPVDIVSGTEDTGLSIDLYRMCSMLWQAVQELSEEVETLKRKNGGKK